MGPSQTVGEFMAMSDDALIDTARDFRADSPRYAWRATSPGGIVAGSMRRAAWCRGAYSTPGQVYYGCVSTVVLSNRIVSAVFFTTRDDADVWSEAQAIIASMRDDTPRSE